MKKANQNRAFTISELLIVAAVIAVLAAVAIPIFVGQLEKSREATDLANVRSAYAAVMTQVNNGNSEARSQVKLVQKTDDWQSMDPVIIGDVRHRASDGDTDNWIGVPTAGGSCEVSYKEGTGAIFNWSGTAVPESGTSAVLTEFENAGNLAAKLTGGGLWSSTTYGTSSGESAMYRYLADVKKTLGDDVGLLKIRLGRDSDGNNYIIGMLYTDSDRSTYTFTDGSKVVTGKVSELAEGSELYKYYTLSYKNQSKYISSDYAGWWWK